jgi:hypothetical protein
LSASLAATLKLTLPPEQIIALEGVGCWLNAGPVWSVVMFVLQALLQPLLSVIDRLTVNEFAPSVATLTDDWVLTPEIVALPLGDDAEIDQLYEAMSADPE